MTSPVASTTRISSRTGGFFSAATDAVAADATTFNDDASGAMVDVAIRRPADGSRPRAPFHHDHQQHQGIHHHGNSSGGHQQQQQQRASHKGLPPQQPRSSASAAAAAAAARGGVPPVRHAPNFHITLGATPVAAPRAADGVLLAFSSSNAAVSSQQQRRVVAAAASRSATTTVAEASVESPSRLVRELPADSHACPQQHPPQFDQGAPHHLDHRRPSPPSAAPAVSTTTPLRRHVSPNPEVIATGAQAKTYRNDPYRARGRVFYFDDSDLAAAPRDEMPEGTRHTTLWGRVSFVPYPATEFRPASPPPPAEGELVRVFVGQLPYFVTDMQLAWLCHTFGGGSAVFYPERIMKRQPNGERLPTGCIHAYATRDATARMARAMHKRMLVDDTGVWHAQTREEFEALTTYITDMKNDRALRIPHRPYDTMVVQMATSTYIPRHVARRPDLAETAVSSVADVVTRPRAMRTPAGGDEGRVGYHQHVHRRQHHDAAAAEW